MSNLRFGLIGVGMMGRNHARVLREIDGVELVGHWDRHGQQHSACRPAPRREALG